ncbi:MAG: hypothetical protein J6V12_01170 [Bacteroidaceae bacterium]|nr:hypothetical protein [Bacteroidaceae bacterium]
MRDDKDLMARCGKKNPFTTPEGYFEHFHEQLMSSLPEMEPIRQEPVKVTMFTRIKPWLYMAAMFVSTVFLIQGLMFIQEERISSTGSMVTEELYTDEIDHFMSSSLYNEYALYSYLVHGE